MPKNKVDFDSAELLYTYHHTRGKTQVGEIRVRKTPDGRVDVRYFTAWDPEEPDVPKATKGGFLLSVEDFKLFASALQDVVDRL